MSFQRQAFRIVRDVIGIVLDWNNRHLSDKEAMKEITRSLLIHKENENGVKKFEEKKENESVEENLKDIFKVEEKKEETVEKTDKIIVNKEKKKDVGIKKEEKLVQKIKNEKKMVTPVIIGAFFILVMVGIVNPYEIISNFETNTSTEEKSIQFRETSAENSEFRNEQFLEIPSQTIIKIENGTKVVAEP